MSQAQSCSESTKRLNPEENKFWRLIKIARELSNVAQVDQLSDKILEEAMNLTNADGGTLFLRRGLGKAGFLTFSIVKNRSIEVMEKVHSIPPIPLFRADGSENISNVVVFSAHTKSIVNIEDAYRAERFDFSGTQAFDKMIGYRTQSVLTVPLLDHTDELIGVVELLNAREGASGEVRPFSEESQLIVEALSALVGVVLRNHLLTRRQHEMLVRLASQSSVDTLFDQVIREAQKLTGAEGGTLYLIRGEGESRRLLFQTVRNEPLQLYDNARPIDHEMSGSEIPLYLDDGQENRTHVASFAALTKELVNIPDAYADERFDFSGTRSFDSTYNYRSTSFLTVPLLNHHREVVGVLQLINARDPISKELIPFSTSLESVIKALANYVAFALNNQLLIQQHKDLLDAFVVCIAKAIDAKSSHTAAHCQRIPVLTQLIAQAACDDNSVLADFSLSDDEWYELKVASWLHDCGKLATPDFILNKSTKLYCEIDGIEHVHQRIEACRRYLQVRLLQSRSSTAAQACLAVISYIAENNRLDDAIATIERANIGGEFMTEQHQAEIRRLAEISWIDSRGVRQNLLNEDEVAMLCIPKGTLSVAERKKVNEHIDVTIEMLETLPFPKNLSRVAEIAGGHHEKIDGSGFPKGLRREDMTLQARMMAVADIFEALTSHERPYKKPMKVSTALGILKNMRDGQHIDPDVFTVFVQGGVWKEYAELHLKPDQLDIDSADKFLH